MDIYMLQEAHKRNRSGWAMEKKKPKVAKDWRKTTTDIKSVWREQLWSFSCIPNVHFPSKFGRIRFGLASLDEFGAMLGLIWLTWKGRVWQQRTLNDGANERKGQRRGRGWSDRRCQGLDSLPWFAPSATHPIKAECQLQCNLQNDPHCIKVYCNMQCIVYASLPCGLHPPVKAAVSTATWKITPHSIKVKTLSTLQYITMGGGGGNPIKALSTCSTLVVRHFG